MFKECYALEKIHGTSAHLKFGETLTYFSGGEKHEKFKAVFDEDALLTAYNENYPDTPIAIYGEAYGGKCQGMSKSYGSELKFVAFEVQIGETWLAVPNAHDVCTKLGIEFVEYVQVPTDLEVLDAERDKDSTQAIRNGMGEGKMREGVVLRPLIEMTASNGDRIMAKHKRPEFSETATPREVSPDALIVLREAEQVADEWVTPMRLNHVMDALRASGVELDITKTGHVIKAMQEDVLREAEGEIEVSKAITNAIAKKAASLYKAEVAKIP